eukprot:Skav213070  [mRNA]  locus=scaffold4152:121720:124484:- [translate_table: standard]
MLVTCWRLILFMGGLAHLISKLSTEPEDAEEEGRHRFFLLQERCNCTLDSLISRMPFPEPEVAFATHALLKAVEHLHTLRIVHRDIKGGNLMVSWQSFVSRLQGNVQGWDPWMGQWGASEL